MSVPPDQPPTSRIPAASRFDQPGAVPPPGTPGAGGPPVSQPPPSQPPAVPPAGYAATPTSAALPEPAPAPARSEPRLTVAAGQYWGGVAATAIVAALVGVAGTLIFESILDIDLVTQDPFDTGSTMGAYVVGAVVGAVVAGALLHLLVLTTPRPRAFFGWIMGLATLVVALVPLTWTDDVQRAACSGVVNLVIGIAIWSLLAGVLARTIRRIPAA
ncbi:DUF6069 family protein [Cellulomonas edaphi]|uniref:DUF6069 family protein n=1 Tax=Cellulomonas edaphi TaxID=3053468 RepID=A0ABT7S9Y6_9CELL|nr:DUF6069 family protein [Cellulomons edaphi]MDM7832420.1 DUF6069 family protein [Cellulomons edaphi]